MFFYFKNKTSIVCFAYFTVFLILHKSLKRLNKIFAVFRLLSSQQIITHFSTCFRKTSNVAKCSRTCDVRTDAAEVKWYWMCKWYLKCWVKTLKCRLKISCMTLISVCLHLLPHRGHAGVVNTVEGLLHAWCHHHEAFYSLLQLHQGEARKKYENKRKKGLKYFT